jgi:hypothetical protein
MKPQSIIYVKADAIRDPIDSRIYVQTFEHMGRQVMSGLVAEAVAESRAVREWNGRHIFPPCSITAIVFEV